MLNRFVCIVVLVFASFLSKAQYKFSSDPAVFVTDINTMMAATKNTGAIQSGTNFANSFNSFSSEHQKKIIEVSQKLSKSKKVKASPHFADFFAALTAAKTATISNSNLDSLLLIIDKITDTYDGKQLQVVFTSFRDFFSKGLLYSSNYNKLRVVGTNYSIKMIGAKLSAEEALIESKDNQVNSKEDTTGKNTNGQKDYFSDWDTPKEEDNGVGNIEDPKQTTDVLDVGYNYPAQPAISGPIIEFKNIDLVFSTQNDSAVLKGTSGSMLLQNGVFVGKGGVMDWSVAGAAPGEITAEMREFNFPVKSIRFVSEGAKLSYKAKTDSIVEGIFEYRENKNKTKSEAQSPRFKSFKSNVDIKGLSNNILYKGGLSLSGNRLYSSSLDEGFSMIEIQKDGKPKIRAFSNRFELGDSIIASNAATLSLYVDEDSITHPGTEFKYNKSTSVLRVSKQGGFNYAPFLDSYHKLEIISDVIRWDLTKNEIDFNIINAKNHIPATFESEEFYHADKFYKLKGLYRFHPLQVVVNYADKSKRETFYAGDVATPLNIDINTFKGAMTQLMKLGYIDYNVKSGLIRIKPKARHYTQSSRNKKDYDNITFVSLSPAAVNASLNLETHELYVRGVDRIYISDSLKVNIAPDNKEIKIEKNRNFKFDGSINTENFQFTGKNFKFVYDTFLVHMPEINQIKLAVVTKKKGKTVDTTAGKSRVLGNELRYSSGTLYINKPDNKSAKKKIPQYPIFDATSGASVYFNKKNINGGAYDTSVQFKIPPFRLDSLSSDDPHTIGFDGTFKSGGIFPDFKEKLVVMPDFSLGFKHLVPKNGYQLYEGAGKFYNTISLDNKGVRGDGEIRYLTTTLWSKDFVFFKDSVKTEGTKTNTKEGTHPDAVKNVTFPKMRLNEYRLRWLPKPDSMFISNIKAPIILYDSTATMIGTTNITKNGMLGKGVLFTRGSISESYKFTFEQKNFEARNATFKIESDDPDKPALLGLDVKLAFDLENNLARFSPEVVGVASNSFPYVQYKSSLQNGEWDLQKKIVTLAKPDSADISNSYFYSTRKDQDSLVFLATKGIYNIPKQTLNISGVPLIKVADAYIYPDSGNVSIEQNAVMTTLQKAKIEIDSSKKYHHLYDGTIDIASRLKFGGVATYRYVNLGNDTLAIKFQDFRLEPGHKKKEGLHTVATGLVKEDDSLFIGPKIIYKGKVLMYAESPYLVFDGFIRFDLKGALNYSGWLKYNNDGETKDVKIDLQNAVSDNGVPLSTGLHLDKRTYQLYTSFNSKKVAQTDPDFFVADKAFEYNLDSNEFRIGNAERFAGKTYEGNNIRYNDSTSMVYYQGKFTFIPFDEKNNNVRLISTGEGFADLNKTDYNFNTLLAFQFNLNSKISSALALNMKNACDVLPSDSTTFSTAKQTADNERLNGKIAGIVGQKGLDNYQTKLALGYANLNGLNSSMGKSITFSTVNLKWSPAFKAFYSVGKLQLAGMQKTDINKEINGFIEIRKTSKGDVVNIYMEPTPDNWEFITYSDNRLACISSDESANKVIRGASKGEMPDRSKFYYVSAELIEKQKFIIEFKAHYLNEAENETEQEETQPEAGKEKKKELQPGDIDVNEPEIGKEEKPAPAATPTPTTTKSKKKKKEKNYDQYKLPDQNNEPAPDLKEDEKNAPTIEDQQQKQQDQQKLKDLFK
ncbi:MAG TPA: hypothetical protein VK766_07770 [Cytophagaceae bacterium]|jgi:hypothetical protein|nr:hypothetical protein [Cytophagaceae bacterium]